MENRPLSKAQQRLLDTLRQRPGLCVIRRPFTRKTLLSDPGLNATWRAMYGGLNWGTVRTLIEAGYLRKERVSSAHHRYYLSETIQAGD